MPDVWLAERAWRAEAEADALHRWIEAGCPPPPPPRPQWLPGPRAITPPWTEQ